MNEQSDQYDVPFFQLIISLQGAAMLHMGKVASPATGKIERNLDLARGSIDMLAMLQRKTEGNLNDEEKRLIDHALYELRMNFVDESKKGDQSDQDAETESTQASEEPAEAEATSTDPPEGDQK